MADEKSDGGQHSGHRKDIVITGRSKPVENPAAQAVIECVRRVAEKGDHTHRHTDGVGSESNLGNSDQRHTARHIGGHAHSENEQNEEKSGETGDQDKRTRTHGVQQEDGADEYNRGTIAVGDGAGHRSCQHHDEIHAENGDQIGGGGRYLDDIGEIGLCVVERAVKYSLQGTTQGRYLTGGVPPVRFSM